MNDASTWLRPASDDDFWIFERQAVDKEFGGSYNWSGYRDLPALRRKYAEDGLLGPDGGRLIVVHGQLAVGVVYWTKVTYGTPAWWCWNIGISLAPESRGSGIGTAAQSALVSHLFETTNAERIEAYTDVENIAEQRALEKVGLTQDGKLRNVQFRSGGWQTLYIYSILRNEFKMKHEGM